MLISEQKHKNRNRKYYHGKVIDKSGNEFYLTTRLEYALIYSDGLLGKVEEYTLKQTADIFNANCKTDEEQLKRFCQDQTPTLLRYLPRLKQNDWTSLGDAQLKYIFIDIIKELNYDGFFNYEIDETALKKIPNNCLPKYNSVRQSPAIAVFNKDILVLNKTWDQYNFKDNKTFVELHEIERAFIEQVSFSRQRSGYSVKDVFNYLKKIVLTFTISELYNILKPISQDEIVEFQESQKRYSEALEKRVDKIYKILEEDLIFD